MKEIRKIKFISIHSQINTKWIKITKVNSVQYINTKIYKLNYHCQFTQKSNIIFQSEIPGPNEFK